MSYFTQILPVEISKIIFVYLDNISLLSIYKISWVFAEFSKLHLESVVRMKLRIMNMRFNIDRYDLGQLIKLLKFKSTKNISIGNRHSLILNNYGKLYVCGSNWTGQLGLSDNMEARVPLLNPYLNDIVMISTGYGHSLVLTKNNELYSFGFGEYGQLGQELYSNTNVPRRIYGISDIIVELSAGYDHSLVLTESGKVFAFGSNRNSELGLNDKNSRNVPTLIESVSNICQIVAGANSSFLLTDNGKVYVCGIGMHLGLGHVGKNTSLTLNPHLSDIVQISAYESHSLFLTNDNEVYACGYNKHGQLGLGTSCDYAYMPTKISDINNIISISTGFTHSLLLTMDGRVYGFGCNLRGQLGLVSEYYNVPTLIDNVSNIVEICASSRDYSLLLDNDGIVHGYGDNRFNQLGVDNNNTSKLKLTLIMNIG